jgi:hypothetical protein
VHRSVNFGTGREAKRLQVFQSFYLNTLKKNSMITKNSIRRFAVVLFAVVVAVIFASQASATLVDVDFSPGAGPAQSGAAVLGSAGDLWNNLTAGSGTAVALTDVTGAATAVTLTYSSGFGGSNAGGSVMDAGTSNLMQDYLAMNGLTFTIGGLTPSSSYKIALYGAGDQNSLNGGATGGQGTLFTILQTPSPTVFGTTTEVNPAAPTTGDRKLSDGPGVAYVLLTANSDATGALKVNVNYNSSSFSTAPVNGFQIVEAVPEPASMCLLGIGGVAMFLVRRRKVACTA